MFAAGFCKGDLLGGLAVGEQAVAADDEGGLRGIRQVQGTNQVVLVRFESDGLAVWHMVPFSMARCWV